MDEMYQAEAREQACYATFNTMNASTLPQVDPLRYTKEGAPIMLQLHDVAPMISAAA